MRKQTMTTTRSQRGKTLNPRGWLMTRFGLRAAFMLALLATLGLIVACNAIPSDADTPEITNHVTDWRDEVIYQVLIDRFANGDVNNDFNVYPESMAGYHGGDYQGLIDRLDYIEALGVTTLWISPVVKNVEEDAGVAGYHGYWTQNFLEVNPHFGDMAKLRELVAACHERDIKVILDIVTNHIGQLFYYDINNNGYPGELIMGSGNNPAGENSSLQRISEWDPDFNENGIQGWTSLGLSGPAPINWVWNPDINRIPPWPPEFANPDWYHKKGRVTVWGREREACESAGKINDGMSEDEKNEACTAYVRLQEMQGDFPGGLKDVNTELPEVREKMVEVYSYWIEQANFDGFRIDTLKHVEHGFWQHFCPGVRDVAKSLGKKNFFMFGEAFDGNDELLGSYTYDNEVDGVFYFSQKFTIDSVFKSSKPEWVPETVSQAVIEGITADSLPDPLPDDWQAEADLIYSLRGQPKTKDIEDLWNYRLEQADAENQVLHYSTTPHENGVTDEDGNGVPSNRLLVNFLDNHDLPRFLYEFDNKAALRNALAFLLTIDGIPCIYYGSEQDFSGGNDPMNREDFWQSGFDTTGDTFKVVQELIQARKDVTPLRRGDLSVRWSTRVPGYLDVQDAGIFAFERGYKGERALVVINTSDTFESETSASERGGGDMLTGFPAGTVLKNVLGEGGTVTVAADQTVKISVGPRETKIFVAQ